MIDENIFKAIYAYCEKSSDSETEVLHELYRETYLKTMAPRMASGPIQGRFLSMLSKLISPVKILEIGTFTGYATICMSEGLTDNGHIYTIEINPELNYISDKYFRKAGIRDRVTSLIGDAKNLILTLDETFDLVFIDAKKKDYELYYNLIINKVNSGGFIIADNVLWDGKVIQNNNDLTTQSLIRFNNQMKDDDRVSTLLLPLRDGVMIMKKL